MATVWARIKQWQDGAWLEYSCDDVDHLFYFDEFVCDRVTLRAACVSILHLINDFMCLWEELDMVSFKNVIYEVVVDCYKQLGLLVVFDWVPDLKQLGLYKSQVILALNQLLDHKVCKAFASILVFIEEA